jgi:AcrR family transcriptional regulator
MNQIAHQTLTAVASHRPNRRALAKQRTRERILASAKALFARHGYEGATVRDIAKAAGMSTGAVFASFADKADLFGEIVEAEYLTLREAVAKAAEGLSGRGAILAILDAAAALHLADLPLFQAAMSALWTPGLSVQVRRRLDRRPLVALIAQAVKQELSCTESADPTAVADLIWDAYAASLRRAAVDSQPLETVRARMRDQVRLILAGARRS